MNSARIRTEKCCLPSLRSFPPHSPTPIRKAETANATGPNDESVATLRSDDDGDDVISNRWEIQVWSHQRQENRMMELACEQIQWLIARLTKILKEHDDGSSRETAMNEFSHLFVRRVADAKRWKYISSWTIFDLQQLASNMMEDSSGKDVLPSFLLSLADHLDSYTNHDEEMHKFWDTMLEDSMTGFNLNGSTPWEDVFLMPYRTAASRVILLYNENTTSVEQESLYNYLCYHAARTLEHFQHFTLPYLKKQCLQQEDHYHNQQQRQKNMVKLNNSAFEQWDDYCMNVLGVESDLLPLFPEVNGEKELSTAIDQYAKEVGENVEDSVRSELRRLSEFFLQLLATNNVDVRVGLSSGGVKCYGKDISNAITYYQQFTQFLSLASGADDNDAKKNEKLSTLQRYVTSSTNGQCSSTDSSLLSQFTTSPATRANLVSDIQQLEVFLSVRKHELSPRSSSHRGGRDIVDATEFEWTQYCIVKHASSPSSSLSLEGISFEDVSRFYDATHYVCNQIVGDGTQPRRLRFLADAVGLPMGNEYHNCLRFQSMCRKAACLAQRMTLYQDQREASCKMVELCGAAKGLTKEEILEAECRMQRIHEGLNESDCGHFYL